MENKPSHTPGPWDWRQVGKSIVLWGDHGHRPIILDAKRVGLNGATFRTRNEFGVMGEFEENADTNLIKAAPEMHAALLAARNRLDSGAKEEREFNAGLVMYIDGVLEKAREG